MMKPREITRGELIAEIKNGKKKIQHFAAGTAGTRTAQNAEMGVLKKEQRPVAFLVRRCRGSVI